MTSESTELTTITGRTKEQQNKGRKILIPYNFCEQIITDKNSRKNVALYLRLKSLSSSGVINYGQYLCDCTGVSWNTLKKRITYLIKQGLAKVRKDKIYLISWDKLKELFNLKRLNFYETNEHDNTEHKLIEMAMRDNYRRQANQINRYKRLYKQYAETTDTRAELENLINHTITLAQETIAKMIGAKQYTDKEGNTRYNYQNAQYYLYRFEKLKILVNKRPKLKFLFQDRKTKKRYYEWKCNEISFCSI